ncbi:hypothetical protein HY404_01185 [Candidatus Microgenomates bacterium]|nr:hypothetical protein [Candidatus Microgenomates bacterium]
MLKKIPLLLVGILLIASFLRLWRLDQVPVSLFGDELDLGYQAYSILKTGRDYSGNFMPLHFQSLAEWRTPLYLYSAVPTVALFGISPLGVRLPAAIFGILGVWIFYSLISELLKGTTGPAGGSSRPMSSLNAAGTRRDSLRPRHPSLPILAALFLAISPWHIQYSRAGFEVTQMLTFFLAGLWFFLRGLKNGKWLPWSAACFALTPWVYSTAKLFMPLFLTALVLIYRKEIFKAGKKWLLWSVVALFLVGSPIAYSTVFGGGTARFSYLSIFTDPTVVPQIGWDRLRDAKVADPDVKFGAQPSLVDRVFHNKLLYWWNMFVRNYLQVFSTQFLFIQGDLNLRHSLNEMGQLYRIDLIFLLAGLAFFIVSPVNGKMKTLIVFWILAAPIPAVLTRDGGMHATRLFFLLPTLIFLIAFGVYGIWLNVSARWKKTVALAIGGVYVLTFILYQHSFWVHYPWESERWWHFGWQEAVKTIKAEENNFDKIIISTAGEPPWIFFAGAYQYPPQKWQENFPFPKTDLPGYGLVSHLDKFYFASPPLKSGIYSLSEFLDEKTLYLANAKEFNVNIIQEPGTLPKNLKLIRAIAYPSGEPAFYLLTLNSQK